jgi:hypothetical protein
MAKRATTRTEDRPARFPRGRRVGLGLFRGLLGAALLAFVPAAPEPAWGGNISITLSPGGITLPDASPDVVPVIGPVPLTVTIKAVGRSGVPWTLLFVANSDLRSGRDVIPISVISWIAAPNPPFMDGTLSAVTPRIVATGITHDFYDFTMNFYMTNSWTYNAGNYTSSATFTLAAP